jgi:Protein of unknown function (DUF2939)
MKKLLALVVLALIGFYVAWPAWSGYRIWNALESQDAGVLEGKIDFASVRESLRPTVTSEVEKQFDAQSKQLGGGLPLGDLKNQILPKLVDGTLATIVTPANILRIYREGGNVSGTVTKIMSEQMGKAGGLPGLGSQPGLGGSGGGSGGLGGLGNVLGGATGQFGLPGLGGSKPAEPQAAPAPKEASAPSSGAKPSYGLSNIKRFGFAGPLGLELGVAKDAAKAGPDLTAGMTFTGFDWKLTRLVPTL